MGHINCTDNFNKGLEKYDISARKSWSAINLFFNTAIDANNVATFDEPWSRPGDYVLFRALKDLTCISSACPCDVDAANGWNPTDIFVRLVHTPHQLICNDLFHQMIPIFLKVTWKSEH